jgi:hypothetical protein
MERSQLEALGRDDLVTRARRLGVGRAELLTRVELVDEIVKRTEVEPERRARARGLLGRARDLLATVIERGLHLPDTARKMRAPAATAVPSQPEPVATVTLAEIYAAQGHLSRALGVLDDVLATEPDHAAALTLRERLVQRRKAGEADDTPEVAEETAADVADEAVERAEDKASPADHVAPPQVAADAPAKPAEKAPPPVAAPARPIPMLDDAPLPERYGVDEAVAMAVDPTTAYVYWEVRPTTMARLRGQVPGGRLMVHVDARTEHEATVREFEAERPAGDYFLFGLPPGARLQARLGWVAATTVDAVAVSPDLSTPALHPSRSFADQVVTWSETPITPQPEAPAAEIAMAVAVAQALEPIAAHDDESEPVVAPGPLPERPLGSSDLLTPTAPGAPHRPPHGARSPVGSSDLSRR